VHVGEEGAFRGACENGHLGVVRELLALEGDRRINVNVQIDRTFDRVCANGHLSVLQELLALGGDRRIDVEDPDAGFCRACNRGHLPIVRELLQIPDESGESYWIDVHWGQENGVVTACVNGHLLVMRELLALEGERRVDVHAENDRTEGRNGTLWCGTGAPSWSGFENTG